MVINCNFFKFITGESPVTYFACNCLIKKRIKGICYAKV